MAFIEKKDPVVINIKITSKGRELLSTGNLSFKYFVIGDSEMDYAFNKATGLNPFNANILRPVDTNPNIISFILKNVSGATGNTQYNTISSIPPSTYLVTNTVDSIGFFTNLTGDTTFIVDGNHVKQPDAMVYMSGVTGGTSLQLRKAPAYGTSGAEPAVGDLILVKWTLTANTTGYRTDALHPRPFLIYQITGITSGTLAGNDLVIGVDRNLPNFSGMSATGKAGALIFYNYINFSGSTIFNTYSTDYLDESVLTFLQNSQCPTVIFPFWNMSIIFTEEIAGVQAADKKFSGFTSVAYGGFVSYIQNQAPLYKKLGVIHYTNDSPANVYAEGFYLTTPRLDIPTIMWYKSTTKKLGLTLVAKGNPKHISGATTGTTSLNLEYYNLYDINDTGLTYSVGKVFTDLKIFVIEDQELLFAMSYKSNRSWTLPNYVLSSNSNGGCA
jgi:hypothetical protein